MRSILAKVLCLLIAFSLSEGQTLIYQTYAWATMLSDRVPQRGLAEAIDSTFSGAEPCHHCKKIAEQQSEKKRDQAPASDPVPTAKAVQTKWTPITLTLPSPTRTPHIIFSQRDTDLFSPDLPAPPPRHA